MAAKHAAHPPPGGDWRRRMAVRGGRVSHTLATAGWAVFAVLGGAFGVLLTVLYMLFPDGHGLDDGMGGRLAAGLLLFVPMGALAGGLLCGLPVQFGARAWLRTPDAAERRVQARTAAEGPPEIADGLPGGSRWAHAYQGCVESVTAFHGVVRAVPEGPAKDWLRDIGRSLDTELAEALRLARLGASVEAGAPGGEVSRSVGSRLEEARAAFHGTTEHAASIALDLRAETRFEAVHAQLDQLAAQAPHLRTGPT